MQSATILAQRNVRTSVQILYENQNARYMRVDQLNSDSITGMTSNKIVLDVALQLARGGILRID